MPFSFLRHKCFVAFYVDVGENLAKFQCVLIKGSICSVIVYVLFHAYKYLRVKIFYISLNLQKKMSMSTIRNRDLARIRLD